MIDNATRLRIANRFSLPPPLVAALASKSPPEQVLANYGIDRKAAEENPEAALMVVAHAVAQSFNQTKTLESALSMVFAGSPTAYESPTSPAGGVVNGILGEAAVKLAHGWSDFKPTDPRAFAAMSHSMTPFLSETKDLGGVVSDEAMKFWHDSVARFAPPPVVTPHVGVHARTGVDPNAPTPKGASPRDVESFAGEMKSLGIDINHFLDHFEGYSSLRYRLLNSKTSLSQYAQVSGMSHPEMLEHVRAQPHPTYPHLTAGQFADAKDLATVHSVPSTGKTPPDALVAKFAGTKAGWKEVGDFYQRFGQKNG